MPPISSPYNFVPLSPRVYFPDWSAQVSHDVPFEDGISGWFEIEVKATTPLYIRNGGDWTEADRTNPNSDYAKFFRTPDGVPAIPGSSFKGMLRSVLEIATFGRMSLFSDRRFGVRDLDNPDLYGKHLNGRDQSGAFYPLAEAGWLTRRGEDSYQITPCEFARVEQEDLEDLRGMPGKLGEKQRADEKYRLWGVDNLTITFGPGALQSHLHSPDKQGKPVYLRYRKADLSKDTHKGTLVFTGQPMQRVKQEPDGSWRSIPKRKHMEFIFFEAAEPQSPLPVKSEVMRDFEFIHTSERGSRRDPSQRAGAPNREWGFWLEQLRVGKRAPVFFLRDKNAIAQLGLALMFRFPYRHSVGDLIRRTQARAFPSHSLDFCETLFGRVEPDLRAPRASNSQASEEQTAQMARSLKGRVSCGELLAEDGWRELPLVTATLGSPKPTFYPNYIRQPIGDAGSGRIAGDYATFMDDDAEISGWKRYPAHPEGNGAFAAKVSTGGTDDTVTRFRPLDQGAVFRGKVRVHNLRPAEVGALLWALSFGGREELRHRLGMAKPLGYGSVTVRLTGHRLRSVADGKEPDVRQCTEAFVGLMTTNVPRWEQSPQLRELLAMGDPHLAHDGRRLDYPRLEMHGPNEFREKKRSRLALVSYSGELPAESGPLPLPPVAPPPPRLLPDLTGQKRQVSFQRSKDNRALGHELWFRVKEGNEKFDAVLRNPKLPKHCGQLRNGDSFPLWVRGIEGDHYLLGETEVDSED